MLNDDEYYLQGRALLGDDFGLEDLQKWYDDEAQGYAGLVGQESAYNYCYHALNKTHGFSFLGHKKFDHVIGIGSAYAHEFLPIIDRIDRLTIIDPGKKFEKSELSGVPIDYRQPEVSGRIGLAAASVDLLTCFGVLHHIPNVTYVISEFGRILRPGGVALIREPITNMGDWRKPRAGLTKRERGIPKDIMEAAFAAANLTIERTTPCMFSGLALASSRLGLSMGYNSNGFVLVDSVLSRLMAWNTRYDRRPIWAKFAPSSYFWVCVKQ